jgi:hypothetical protein
MALAPCVGPFRGASLQVGPLPPPSSSVKMMLVPPLLNVAECQNAKFASRTWSRITGFSGSVMSMTMPSPMHAPAARPRCG